MTTEDDVQQAVKDAPVLGTPTTMERPESEERDIGTLQWYECEDFSLKRDEKEFLTFLIILGCPPSSTILTSILTREHKVQVVVVEELSSTDVLTLYKSIHFPQTNRKFFDVPLYCKVVRNINLHQ